MLPAPTVPQLLCPPAPPARSSPPASFGSLPEQTVNVVEVAVLAHESFQVVSGMYDLADSRPVPLFVAAQKVDGFVASSKSVPPTATLNGVEAVPLICSPASEALGKRSGSQAADPVSPLDTSAVMP